MKRHKLGELDQDGSIAFCEKLFAETLDGAKLMTNARHLRGSAWLNFSRLTCGTWSCFNGRSHVVLMGDAAHTAHFAIGSGTKLALDDAIELANQFDRTGHDRERIGAALAAYEDVRRVDVARIQNAARNAMEWFEVVGRRYADTLEPEQFFYSMLTRSQRISHENLRLRDPAWLEVVRALVRAPLGRPRERQRTTAAADADAAFRARRYAEEPHHGFADGHVFEPGRADQRLPHRASRRPRHGRRKPGLRGDDLRLGGRANYAGLPRPVERRAGAGNGSGLPISSIRPASPSSAARSATPAAKARRGFRGRGSTSRSIRATGR